MNNQFFFMFSEGCYSDYRVGGLYVCDHAVSQEEWREYYKAYQDEVEARLKNAMIEYGKRVGCGHITTTDNRTGKVYISLPGSHHGTYWFDAERKQVEAWQKKNDPEETFRKLHNMQPVHYEELWRD